MSAVPVEDKKSVRKSVVIIQPYVPKYRFPFFQALIEALDKEDIDCRVVAGKPDRVQAQRDDSVSAPWLSILEPRSFKIFGRSVNLGAMPSPWTGADGVIVGLVGTSVETYRALSYGSRRGIKVGVWGHVKSYVSKGSRIDAAAELWQMRRADQVFAYTQGGAQYAINAGIDVQRVTTVMNSIDTEELSKAVRLNSESKQDRFNRTYSLKHGRVLAFWGGLDESKRIDFLSEVLDLLWEVEPDVRILIGGKGSQAGLLKKSVARGQVHMLGYVDADVKALIGGIASALLIPGRIGLVAVEALLLGLPIITTEWPFHAPEAEYLVEGDSLLTAENSPAAYVGTIQTFLLSSETAVRNNTPYPTMQDMVSNFSLGVKRMLGRGDQF